MADVESRKHFKEALEGQEGLSVSFALKDVILSDNPGHERTPLAERWIAVVQIKEEKEGGGKRRKRG
jgi:hypothetical protein